MFELKHLKLLPPDGVLPVAVRQQAIEVLRHPALRQFLAAELYRALDIKTSLKLDVTRPLDRLADDAYNTSAIETFNFLLKIGDMETTEAELKQTLAVRSISTSSGIQQK